MLFTSPEFILLFFPLALVAFLAVRRLRSLIAVLGTLVAVSLALYFYSEPRFEPVMLISVTLNFLVGREMRRQPRAGTGLFWLGIVLNLAPFIYFKYAPSLQTPASAWSHWVAATLPLGISFFSFQQIAYLLEVRRNTIPDVSFTKYMLFVLFFPHLVAGPIVRHNELVGQFTLDSFCQNLGSKWSAALSLFAIALLKKIVIADHLAAYVEPVLGYISSGATPNLLESWAVMLSAAAQIYFDYSAYGDMALALALSFGLHLPVSFYSPYQALRISDFWRRWNVPLMRFFRDHVYIPLGGNRHGRRRQILAVFATMICCGLWHGAGGNFAAWGALVASLIAAELVLAREPSAEPGLLARVLSRFVVLLAYVGPLTFFLFPSLADSSRTLSGMLGLNGFAWPPWIEAPPAGALPTLMPGRLHFVLLVVAWAAIYLAPNTYEIFKPALSSAWTDPALVGIAPKGIRAPLMWAPTWAWGLVTAILVSTSLATLGSGSARAFFYFRF